jgi:glutathione S-transferase
MKLYTGQAPNALRVSVFLAEKKMDIPIVPIDVMKGDTRTAEHRERNSLGEIPVLELDDGSYLSESVAICRYFELLNPEPPLMGVNPQDIANIEMWNRRMEHLIMGPCAQYGSHTIPIFSDKIEQLPEYASTQKRQLQLNWKWLETELADDREFICGNTFTIADITGMAALMICGFTKLEIPNDLPQVQRWTTSMYERASWPK